MASEETKPVPTKPAKKPRRSWRLLPEKPRSDGSSETLVVRKGSAVETPEGFKLRF